MSSPEVTTVTHPDGTTITTTSNACSTETTVVHSDGTTLVVATEDEGADKPKQRVLLPATVTPSHYDVHLTPDLEAFTFAGTETVSVCVNGSAVQEVVLHSLDIRISEASFVGSDGAETTATAITYQPEKLQTTTLAFGTALPQGGGSLKITFTGELNDKMCGFYRSTYVLDGEKKIMATTQFEATDARRAFPCWDEPAQKATFAFTLTVPDAMTAVSNMPVKSTEPGPTAGTKTVAFDTTVKMSSYLGAFVIGDMNYIEGRSTHGIPCRVYATAGKEAQGEFALDVCGKVLDFFDDYFGIPYPLPKMDMLAIPDFAAGAMENYGCVTYRETAILWDPDKSAASAKQRVAYVVAHELAHQWFGNLTTMQWWDNLWLNEGFATFVGTMAVDKLFPEWAMWTQFVKDDWANALSLDSMRSSHPIQVEVFSADEVSEIFDAISYYKGASVIRAVFDWIGEAAFQTGLQAYLTQFAYSNTVTDDLWDAWGTSSGKPVKQVMSSWTLQQGYPLLSVTEGAGGAIDVTQQRFIKDGSVGEGLWQIPVSVLDQGSSSSDGASPVYTLLEGASGTLQSSADGGWVKINPGQAGVYRVRYSPELLAKLAPQVASLSASDRIGLVGDAFALATAGLTPVTSVLQFLLGFVDETEYTVWSDIVSGLGAIKMLLASDPDAYANLKSFMRTLYGKVAADIGWEKKEGEGHTDALKRALILKAMGGADDEAVAKVAAEKFELLKSGEADVDSDLKSLVYALACANGGDDAYATLLEMYNDPGTMSEEKVRILQSLGSTKDEALMAKTLGMLLDDSSGVRPQDAMYCVAGVSMNLVYGRQFAWRWMKEHWEELFSKFGTGGSFTLPRLVSTSTKCLVTVPEADDVESFFKVHSVEGAARTVAQSVEAIRTSAAMGARENEALKAWLAAM